MVWPPCIFTTNIPIACMYFRKISTVLLSALCGLGFSVGALAQNLDLADLDSQKVKDAVLQDARKQSLEKQPDVQAALKAVQDSVMLRAWEQQLLKNNPITQAQRDAAYKEYLAMLGANEYRINHINPADADQAQALIARLQGGLSWDKVEVNSPTNPETKITADNTDWVNLAAVPAEFREAIKLLKPGQVYPTPIRNNNGWHVLGLSETRPLKAPTMDQVKAAVDKLAERKLVKDKIVSLLPR